MDLATLSAAVDKAFDVTGAGLTHWPDPRPDGRPPRDDEYSRCLDPGKYRLLSARADAWVVALTGLGLGREREVPVLPAWQVRGRPPASRAVRVEPHATDAVPLVFVHWAAAGDSVPAVEVRAADPALPVVRAPECGCDACDDGSRRQLEALDEGIVPVVAGEWLHVHGPGTSITATTAGWSASRTSSGATMSSREIRHVVEEARAGRSAYPVVASARWW